MYTFNFATGKSQYHSDSNIGTIIEIDNGNLYYIPWFFSVTQTPVHRMNLDSKETEFVYSLPGSLETAVDNSLLYYYDDRTVDPSTGVQSEYKCIKAYDVNKQKTSIVKNFTDYSEYDNVHYLTAKYGYLMYIGSNVKLSNANARQYIINTKTKEETLLSEFWISSY